MAAPHVLLVGGADVPEIRAAVGRCGARILTLSFPSAIAHLTPGDDIVLAEPVDFSRPLDVVRRIRALHRHPGFDAVVPVTEYGLLPASMAAADLGVPVGSVAGVRNTRDKVRMRRVLDAAGLGTVRWAACRSRTEAMAFLERIGAAIIVKPIAGSGSDGVARVDRSDELARAWDLAASAPGFSGVLCEEFIDGEEVSLEGCTIGGRFVPVAITDKLIDARFLEIGHDQPTRHAPEICRAVADAASAALGALGVDRGVTHSEFKLTAAGPVLIETHTRMGGDQIHVLTRHTTGVDLADVMVAQAMGEQPVVQPVPTGRAAVIRFLVGRRGRLAGVSVPPVAPGSAIDRLVVHAAPGHVIDGRSSSMNRLGYVIATAEDRTSARRAAERCVERMHVDYLDDADQREGSQPWTAPAA